MRKIPTRKRMEVLKLYFLGYTFDDVAKKAGVSKGSVVNIVKELKEGRYPDFENVLDIVDELRNLAVEIKKNNLELPQASLGLKFYGRIQGLGVEPQILDGYIKMCERISTPDFTVDKFVNTAIKLCRLEGKLGKTYEEALKDLEGELEGKSSKLGELKSQVEALEGRKVQLESELRGLEARLLSERKKLTGLTRGAESLEKLGTDKVCRLSTFGRECEELGYSVDKLMELVRLVDKKASLEKQVSALNNRLSTLGEHVKRVMAESRGLSAASGMLKSRTTSMACSYCGRTIVVPIPTTLELENSLKRGLIYPTGCQYCGYTNHVSPRDILASIGWSILAI